jgi:hypothetical protein
LCLHHRCKGQYRNHNQIPEPHMILHSAPDSSGMETSYRPRVSPDEPLDVKLKFFSKPSDTNSKLDALKI